MEQSPVRITARETPPARLVLADARNRTPVLPTGSRARPRSSHGDHIALDSDRSRTTLLVDPPKDSPGREPSDSGFWDRGVSTKKPKPGKKGDGGGITEARGARQAKAVVAGREERRHVVRR